MKKLFIVLISTFILCSHMAYAEVDLSGMTYNELVDLKNQINKAIWDSDEWQMVLVPQGVWEIGVDIPEGLWTIGAYDGTQCVIEYGDSIDETGTRVRNTNNYPAVHEIISSPSYYAFRKGRDIDRFNINLTAGHYLKISSGDSIFMSYSGKPDLKFKK